MRIRTPTLPNHDHMHDQDTSPSGHSSSSCGRSSISLPAGDCPQHAKENIREYPRQSTAFGSAPISPPGVYFDPRVPSYSFHSYSLPFPAVAGSTAHIRSSSQNDTFRSALINFAGALCLGIVAAGYASPDTLKSSRSLVVSVTCGTIGCLFTLAALSLDGGRGARWFLRLSLISAAFGSVCMIAATQTWVLAMFAGICIIATVGAVWRLREQAR